MEKAYNKSDVGECAKLFCLHSNESRSNLGPNLGRQQAPLGESGMTCY
jgi:hypothetical protein